MSGRMTYEEASRLFKYDPTTGEITRRVTVSSSAKSGNVVGCPDDRGYLRVVRLGRWYTVHRLAFFLQEGRWPNEIDHINGRRDDNRWCNLREVSHSENLKNTKLPTHNNSGVIGVFWNKRLKKWETQIVSSGVQIHLGLFKKKQDAIDARKSSEREHAYNNNHGRK